MDSIRDALEAAWDAADTDEPVPADAGDAGGDADGADMDGGDEPGQVADADAGAGSTEPSGDGAEQSAAGDAPGEGQDTEPADEPESAITAEPPATGKAPVGWNAEARQRYATLPKAVRDEIARTNSEIESTLQRVAEERKGFTPLQEAVAPFEQQIRASNLEPAAVVGSLLNTVHRLSTGDASAKAQIVANLIQSYKVPIDMLADAIDGKELPSSTAHQLDQALERRLAPIEQQLTAQQEQTVNHKRAENTRALDAFAQDHQHLDALSEEMADIMEYHAQRGREVSLDSAYRTALAGHPELQQQQRQRVMEDKLSDTGSLAPNGNVTPTPPLRPAGDSVRDAVMLAFNNAEG